MQKIGDTTPTADENGEFTDGDPQKQISCTWIMAAWLNTLQRELVKVVQEGGLTLDPSDDTQLYQAIEKLMGTAVEGVVRSVNTHEPDDSGDIKLGTAADADIGTDAGNVLGVGAFGLMPSMPLKQDGDFNNYKTFGFYRLHRAQNPPPSSEPGGNWHLQVTSSSNGAFVIQTAYGIGQDSTPPPTPGRDINRIFVRTYYAGGGGMWSKWVEFYSENHKPTAQDTGALPLTGGTVTGPTTFEKDVTVGGDSILEKVGKWIKQTFNGSTAENMTWRYWGSEDRPSVCELDIDGGIWLLSIERTKDNKAALGVNGVVNCEGVNVGSARMAADGNIWGDRWTPGGGWLWDAIVAQVQNIGQLSASGTQWWAKINLNGGTLIVQGGYAEVREAEVTDRIPLNIAVPNHLLGVFITNRNFAQGYATYNPQVTVLTDDNTGFNFVHGQKERMMYWIAVGY